MEAHMSRPSQYDLEKQVMAHRYLYYVLSKPVISDTSYDDLERLAKANAKSGSAIFFPGSGEDASYSDDAKILAMSYLDVFGGQR
jgi:hypothetical protein